MEGLSVEGVCSLLLSKGVSQDVLNSFEEHGINGEVFQCLTQDPDYIKELAPVVPPNKRKSIYVRAFLF